MAEWVPATPSEGSRSSGGSAKAAWASSTWRSTPRLGRRVALKVIAPQLALDEEFRARFTAEARAAAAIDDPNTVPVYSAGVADEHPLHRDALRRGHRPAHGARRAGPVDPETTSTVIVAEIAGALDSAHRAGMVHRDVKPANILLEGELDSGRAYLTDFGLTKGRSESEAGLTGTGQWVGTIDYVAPEQIQAGRVDARADVYALGCVLYEMLAGRIPFSGNDMQKMWGHVNEPFPSLEGEQCGRRAGGRAGPRHLEGPRRALPLGRRPRPRGDGRRQRRQHRHPGDRVATGAAAQGLDETALAKTSAGEVPGAGETSGRAPPRPSPGSGPTRRRRGWDRPAPPTRGRRQPDAHRPDRRRRGRPRRGPDRGRGADRRRRAPTAAATDPGRIGGNRTRPAKTATATGPTRNARNRKNSGRNSRNRKRRGRPCRRWKRARRSARQRSERATPAATSPACGFAVNVADAYFASGESQATSSPQSLDRQDYPMTCGGFDPVICTGGTEAAVYIFP